MKSMITHSFFDLILIVFILPISTSFVVHNNLSTNMDKRDEQIECLTQEEYPASTFVENIAKKLDLNQRRPPEVMNLLRFTFLTQPSCPEGQCFVMDERTGDLRTALQIDRDLICPRAENCEIAFDIAIQPIEYFIIVKVKVEIIDINDNVPSFPQPVVNHQIHEFAEVGTGIVIPAASDPDSPKYGIQRYALLQRDPNELNYETDSVNTFFNTSFYEGNIHRKRSYDPYLHLQKETRIHFSQKFELKHKTTADGGTDLRLVLQEKLDRELEDHYMVTVLAIDGGSPPMTGSVVINITVQDANDNSPIFENAPYEVTVPENFPVNSLILKVKAKDKDIGLNAAIVYEFSESTRLDYGHLFSIKPDSGKIFLKNNLDYEGTTKVYQLYVIATDKGPDSIPARASVAIRVEDVNDHSPQIQVKTLTVKTFAEVQENSNVGTFVAHLSVTDSDSGDNGRFLCQVDDQNFKLSQVYDMELTVVTAKVLDRELKEIYDLSISCRDFGQQPHTSSVPLKVLITDENDNDPLFEKPLYEAALKENSPVGTVILKVTANDPDADENGRISYNLTDGPNLVTIEEDSGVLRSAISFDFEQINELEFQLTASDHGQVQRSSNTRLKIVIIDENDSRPVFERESYEFKIQENMPAGTFIGGVKVYDEESKLNKWDANFVYLLETLHDSGSSPYYLPISKNKARDHNYDFILDKRIRQTSHDVLSHYKRNRKDISIMQKNKNKIEEHSKLRKNIRSSNNYFAKESLNKQLETYQTTPNVLDLFEVDSSSGRISTRQVLDREYRESYKFFVTAFVATVSPDKSKQRGNNEHNRKGIFKQSNEILDMRPSTNLKKNHLIDLQTSHTATVLVAVHIEDVNDNRPYFLFPPVGNETIEISSQTPPGYVIARLKAIDPDHGANAELTYHILSFSAIDHVASKVANKRRQNFRLSPTTGELTILGDLSDVIRETYSFELVARDAGKPQLNGHSRLKITINSDILFSGYSRFSYDSAYGILASEDTVVVLAFTLALVLLAIIIIIGVMCALKKRTDDGRNSGGNGTFLSNSPQRDGEVRRRLFQNATKSSLPGCECLIDSYSSSVVGTKQIKDRNYSIANEDLKNDKDTSCCCYSRHQVLLSAINKEEKNNPKKNKLLNPLESNADVDFVQNGKVSNGCHLINNKISAIETMDVLPTSVKATAILNAYVTPDGRHLQTGADLKEVNAIRYHNRLEVDRSREENYKNEKLHRMQQDKPEKHDKKDGETNKGERINSSLEHAQQTIFPPPNVDENEYLERTVQQRIRSNFKHPHLSSSIPSSSDDKYFVPKIQKHQFWYGEKEAMLMMTVIMDPLRHVKLNRERPLTIRHLNELSKEYLSNSTLNNMKPYSTLVSSNGRYYMMDGFKHFTDSTTARKQQENKSSLKNGLLVEMPRLTKSQSVSNLTPHHLDNMLVESSIIEEAHYNDDYG